MTEPCPHEMRITSLERRQDDFNDYLKKLEDKLDAKLDLILMQLSKVAILEEKHNYQSTALERAFSKITVLEASLESLKEFKNKTEGMARMAWLIWTAMGLSLGAILTKVW